MPYYNDRDELNALRKENRELKEKIQKLELKTVDFSKCTYSELMKFYVAHFAEYAYDSRGLENAGLGDQYEEWNNAFAVFKAKRKERSNLINLYMKKYFATKQSGEILVQHEIVMEIMPDIKKIYQNTTPFDCEDSKWTDKYSDQCWVNRIHSFFSEFARLNGLCFREQLIAKKK